MIYNVDYEIEKIETSITTIEKIVEKLKETLEKKKQVFFFSNLISIKEDFFYDIIERDENEIEHYLTLLDKYENDLGILNKAKEIMDKSTPGLLR